MTDQMTALRFIEDILLPGALLLGGVAGCAAFVLTVFEELAIRLFVPWVFRLGPIVLRQPRTLRPPIWPTAGSNTIALQYGFARVLSPTECLFRENSSLDFTRRFYSRGCSPLRGMIRWRGTQAHVEARMSAKSALLYSSFSLVVAGAGGKIALAGAPLKGAVVLLFSCAILAGLHRGYKSDSAMVRGWVEEILAELGDALPQAP